MCNPVSGLIDANHTIHLPDPATWEHSHSALAKKVGIPDGLIGDKWVRFELTPKDDDFRSDISTWRLRLDEDRKVDWWADDLPAIDDKIRRKVKRYIEAAMAAGAAPQSAISATSGAASATGYCSSAANTGHYSSAANTGYYSSASVSGKESAAVAVGFRSAVRGAEGCALLVAERDDTRKLIGWVFGVVGEKGINPDVWYEAKNGKFVACNAARVKEIEDVIAKAGAEAVKPEQCGPKAK